MTEIDFRFVPGGDPFQALVKGIIERTSPRSIGDLGGGANPILSPEFIAEHGLDYTVFDVSDEELGKAPAEYAKVVADLSSGEFRPPRPLDLVLSRWLVEHIADPQRFHRTVFDSLVEGGRAVHAFPTLYAIPFLANLLLPEAASARLVSRMFPNRRPGGRHGKFRAHYRWCRGPTPRQLRRFRDIGYEVEEYVGFFGHRYYERWPRLQDAEDRLARLLVNRPVPPLTSFAWVVLRKAPATR
jgi:SAM-dependent methyltransferase